MTYSGLGASSFFYYFFWGSGFSKLGREYFDGGHDDKEVTFLDTEFIEFISVGGGFAFEDDFLGVNFDSLLIFDFGFEIEDLE